MISLNEVHETYRKWLFIEDLGRIDIMLAVAISRILVGTKLWIIFVGSSGDGKTEQIMALEDGQIKYIRNFTSKTLVNGNPNVPDLAPQLKNKILCIPDMATILKLHPNEKGAVWGQLRDLYDGIAGKQSGMGKDVDYRNLNVTLIAGSTPMIDNQIMIFQELGTRELIYRTTEDDLFIEQKIMDKVQENEDYEEEMREQLKIITSAFVKEKEIELIDKQKEIRQYLKEHKEIDKKLRDLAIFITYMRASASTDNYTQEVTNPASRERPTRIYKQLIRFFICLKSLDEEYQDQRIIEIITKLIDDSCDLIRLKVFKKMLEIANSHEVSMSAVANELNIGKSVTTRELNVLWNLRLINRITYEKDYYGKKVEEYKWTLNEDHYLIKELK